MIFDKEVRDRVVENARTRFRLLFPELVDRPCCLHWAWVLMNVISEELDARKIRASCLLQAGTAAWPRISLDKASADEMTHWGFQWEGPGSKELSDLAEANGALREIHIWVGIVPRYPSEFEPELIDITTGLWPQLFAEVAGEDSWPGKLPPDYFWTTQGELPGGVVYDAKLPATEYALKSLIRLRAEGALP